MKAALKKKWIAALRSGKYRQGQSYLYHGPERLHCCLGVLYRCETGTNPKNGSALLGKAMRRRMGLSDEIQDDLVTMNDTGLSFARIATWIEKHL